MQEKILVSACLAGENCKYNGGNNFNERIVKLVNEGKVILVCPEQLGGLKTPRIPSEILKDRVINKEGEDVTKEFQNGAEKALKIAKENNIKKAILKSKSPSCGYGKIYDGCFTGKLVNGNGITTKLFLENGIEVLTEEDF